MNMNIEISAWLQPTTPTRVEHYGDRHNPHEGSPFSTVTIGTHAGSVKLFIREAHLDSVRRTIAALQDVVDCYSEPTAMPGPPPDVVLEAA
jgi:hypothetical protein